MIQGLQTNQKYTECKWLKYIAIQLNKDLIPTFNPVLELSQIKIDEIKMEEDKSNKKDLAMMTVTVNR